MCMYLRVYVRTNVYTHYIRTVTSGTVRAAIPGGSGGRPVGSDGWQVEVFGVKARAKLQVAKKS